MKKVYLFYAGLFCLAVAGPGGISYAQTLPEQLTAGADSLAISPLQTVYLYAEDPVEGASLATELHGNQALKGWELFSISPYYIKGKFRGFFITYKTNLRL